MFDFIFKIQDSKVEKWKMKTENIQQETNVGEKNFASVQDNNPSNVKISTLSYLENFFRSVSLEVRRRRGSYSSGD